MRTLQQGNDHSASTMHTHYGQQDDQAYLYEEQGNKEGYDQQDQPEPSCCAKLFTGFWAFCTILNALGAGAALGGSFALRSAIKDKFTCALITDLADIVTAVGFVFLFLAVVVLVLLVRGSIGRLNARAFPMKGSGSGSSKCCVILSTLVLFVFAAVAIIGTLLAFSFWRLSLAEDLSVGKLRTLQGLDGEVTLWRDPATAHPTINATTKRDLFFMQGYAQAESRLFQLEFMRLLTSGRLAEFTGKAALKIDKQIRTLGLNRAAQWALDEAPAETKEYLNRFAEGINYFMKTRHERPVEFAFMMSHKSSQGIIPQMRLFTWHEPEPFTAFVASGAARLIAFQMMGDIGFEAENFKTWWANPKLKMEDVWTLRNNFTNYSTPILSTEALGDISAADIEEQRVYLAKQRQSEIDAYNTIFDPARQKYSAKSLSSPLQNENPDPNYYGDLHNYKSDHHQEEDPENDEDDNEFEFVRGELDLLKHFKVRHASNGWAARNSDGATITVSDPHLVCSLVSVWEPVTLLWGTKREYSITGVALSGMPGIGIGSRQDYSDRENPVRIYWAITSSQNDYADAIALNQTGLTNPDEYYYGSEKKSLVKRVEKIKVMGEDDYNLEVADSVYGRDVSSVYFKESSDSNGFKWKTQDGKSPFRFCIVSNVFNRDNSSLDAFMGILDTKVRSAPELRMRVASSLLTPNFNLAVSDSLGNVVYATTGTYVKRFPEHSGAWPHMVSPSRNGKLYEKDRIEYSKQPGIVLSAADKNRAAFVATANQKLVPDGFKLDGSPQLLGFQLKVLQKGGGAAEKQLATFDYQSNLQSSIQSGFWIHAVQPAIKKSLSCFTKLSTRVASSSSSDSVKKWIEDEFLISSDKGAKWEGQATADTTTISFFWFWIQQFSTFVDPVQKYATGKSGSNDFWMLKRAMGLADGGFEPQPFVVSLCKKYVDAHKDLVAQNSGDICPEAANDCIRAFVLSFVKTAQKYPSPDSTPRWATNKKAKPFYINNLMMSTSPLACIFDRRVLMKSGDVTAISVSDFALTSKNFKSVAASSMRQIYSSLHPDRMLWSIPGGQSGNPFSKYYTNLLEKWTFGHYMNLTLLQ